jgi:nucleoside-diphosphate-sugar epimerase
LHAFITGGGGFIGRNLAIHFLKEGWRVTTISRNLVPGLESSDRLTVIHSDIKNLNALPRDSNLIIHCASDIPAYCPDGDVLYKNNVFAAKILFELASLCRIPRIINLSSMSVYGQPSTGFVSEATNCLPTDLYGKSKLEIEHMLHNHSKGSNSSAYSLRLPGIVGKGSHNNFISKTVSLALAGKTIIASNPNSFFNNIIHISDLVRFIEYLGRLELTVGHISLTLGASNEIKIKDLINKLLLLTSSESVVQWNEQEKPSFLIHFDLAKGLGFKSKTVEASLTQFVFDVESNNLSI